MGCGRLPARAKKGQRFIEYTPMILMIAAARTAMTVYITRSRNARIEEDGG